MTEPVPDPTHLLQKRDFFEDPSLPLQVSMRDPQPPFPKHSHAFDELVIILKGTAMHVVDEHHFPVKSGDVFVITPNHAHQYRERHGLVLANILFDAEALLMHRWDIRALPGFTPFSRSNPPSARSTTSRDGCSYPSGSWGGSMP